MAWGGAGGPPARAHPVFGRFLKKKLYSFGLTVDPDRDDSLAQMVLVNSVQSSCKPPWLCKRFRMSSIGSVASSDPKSLAQIGSIDRDRVTGWLEPLSSSTPRHDLG